MLTVTALKRLKPKERDYKVADRDSMYAVVKPSGVIISLRLSPEWTPRDADHWALWAGRDIALWGKRAVLRRTPIGRRREVACARETAQKKAPQGG